MLFINKCIVYMVRKSDIRFAHTQFLIKGGKKKYFIFNSTDHLLMHKSSNYHAVVLYPHPRSSRIYA